MFATLLIIYFVALLGMIFAMHFIAVAKSEQEIFRKYRQEHFDTCLDNDQKKGLVIIKAYYLFKMRYFQ